MMSKTLVTYVLLRLSDQDYSCTLPAKVGRMANLVANSDTENLPYFRGFRKWLHLADRSIVRQVYYVIRVPARLY